MKNIFKNKIDKEVRKNIYVYECQNFKSNIEIEDFGNGTYWINFQYDNEIRINQAITKEDFTQLKRENDLILVNIIEISRHSLNEYSEKTLEELK